MSSYTDEYENITFTKENYEGLDIGFQRFIDCTFNGCNLSKTTFLECDFQGCTFHNCDMSLMAIRKCSFKKIKLSSSKAIGINWSDAANPFTIECIDSNISYSTFAGKAIKKAVFKGCKVHEVDFTQCNLAEADFSKTDLTDSRFVHCDLSQADFSNAISYNIDLKTNKVKGAIFSMPEAMTLLDSFGIVVQ